MSRAISTVHIRERDLLQLATSPNVMGVDGSNCAIGPHLRTITMLFLSAYNLHRRPLLLFSLKDRRSLSRNYSSKGDLKSPSMASHPNFQAANDKYVADFGDKGSLPLPPAKKVRIICGFNINTNAMHSCYITVDNRCVGILSPHFYRNIVNFSAISLQLLAWTLASSESRLSILRLLS